MSTKSTILNLTAEDPHALQVHIYSEMHQPAKTIVVELTCNTCNCAYQWLMDEHLGLQLAALLKKE